MKSLFSGIWEAVHNWLDIGIFSNGRESEYWSLFSIWQYSIWARRFSLHHHDNQVQAQRYMFRKRTKGRVKIQRWHSIRCWPWVLDQRGTSKQDRSTGRRESESVRLLTLDVGVAIQYKNCVYVSGDGGWACEGLCCAVKQGRMLSGTKGMGPEPSSICAQLGQSARDYRSQTLHVYGNRRNWHGIEDSAGQSNPPSTRVQ